MTPEASRAPSGTEQPLAAKGWDELSEWWLATFSNGADIEYERQILPLAMEHLAGCEQVLDVGTGEGQLARRVARSKQAALVAGVDPSAAQLANAASQGGGPAFVRARGEQLPFADGAFDGIVCCLVIEHADDPDAVLAEMARLLAPGGRLLLLVNHPVVQGPGSGLVDDTVLGERYWRIGPYLTRQTVVEEVDAGVPLRFAHRPLSGYVNPLCEHGLVLTRLEEPPPPIEFLTDSLDLGLERAMPRLCLMRFERLRPARRPRSARRRGGRMA
ncbi:MAG TPA: class I SAM-dependent methyltransferase [Acidimicrobiales bacterium]|nr:class I SAM-dependent methyltransferase [Acidimicrobiales bacterium]